MRRQINAEELKLLYNKIEQVIWFSQHLESALVTYIILKGLAKESGELTKNEADKHQLSLNKQPLGRLIAKAKNLSVLDKVSLGRLMSFNERRKWVVHNSIREDVEQLYTTKGRCDVFDKLDAIICEAQKLHNFIGEQVVEYSVSKGQDKEVIYKNAEKNIESLKGL